MRTRTLCCALACAAMLGANGSRANPHPVCPPSCGQHAPVPHLAQSSRGVSPSPLSPVMPSRPFTPHPMPGWTAGVATGQAQSQSTSAPKGAATPSPRTPYREILGGFTRGPENNWSPQQPVQSAQGQSGGPQSPPSSQTPNYKAEFAIPPGFTAPPQSLGAPPQAYAQVGYPASSPRTSPALVPTPMPPALSAEPMPLASPPQGSITGPALGLAQGQSVSVSQGTVPSPRAPQFAIPGGFRQEPSGQGQPIVLPLGGQGNMGVVYACHTPVGICPVTFSGPAEAGSACVCVDAGTGRQDNGAIQ